MIDMHPMRAALRHIWASADADHNDCAGLDGQFRVAFVARALRLGCDGQ